MSDTNQEFGKIIVEFVYALIDVYPEYKQQELDENITNIINGNPTEENMKALHEYCKNIFPVNIFNIMGKNEDIFLDKEVNTQFLPGIDIKQIWNATDISENTKETIWKYLQLILFTIVGNIQNMDSFGETAKLFESIDEDELKDKLQETFTNMEKMFSDNDDVNTNKDECDGTNTGSFNMPNVNNIHDHLKGLMGGKLGKLAAEIAEETAQELDIDENDQGSVKEVFQSMMRNPQKIMGIANKIGGKLESKMKSGDIDEKELMKEAADMFSKMKNTPGMGDIEKMMRSMGGLGRKGKIDTNAMQQRFDSNEKRMKMQERAIKAAELKREQQRIEAIRQEEAAKKPHVIDPELLKELGITSPEEIESFTCGEKPERTPRNPSHNAKKSTNKKKKKGKK